MSALLPKAVACTLAAFVASFWLSGPAEPIAKSTPNVYPTQWLLDEHLVVKGRRMAQWSSHRDSATETRLSAAHFRARGLSVSEAYEEGAGGMITLSESGHRLIINIVSTPGGSAITLVSGPKSKEVAP